MYKISTTVDEAAPINFDKAGDGINKFHYRRLDSNKFDMEEIKVLLKKVKGIKKIENEEQYNQMVARVELLLPLVDDDTPEDDPNRIELEMLSNLVADYSDDHFDINREF